MNGELIRGTILHGRYKIEWEAGGGNMGVVYKAVDMQLNDRSVAIKEMLPPDPAKNGLDLNKAVRFFKREAAILSGLNHPNLPHVYDTFQEQGKYYLVMDYIEGDTLLQKLAANGWQPLDVRDMVDYAIQLCEIFDYLHTQHPQVIFRDLKPSNVMIDHGGRVFLIDFGIARHFNPAQAGDTVAIGTSGYSDPEISLMHQANPRSDLYGLGATLHHCLTGKIPDYESSAYQFPPVVNFNGSVPPRLNQLIMQLVEPLSAGRPASAEAVKQALLPLQGAFQGLGTSGTVVDHDAPTEADPPVVPIPPTVRVKPLSASIGKSFSRLAVTVSPVFSTIWKALFLLFSLVFVAGRFVFGMLLSPVTHRRVHDLWQQARQGGRVVFQQIQQGYSIGIRRARQIVPRLQHLRANWSWAWLSYSPIWRPRFLTLLGSLLALMIAISVFLLRVFHGSYYLVDLSLSLPLLFIVYIIRHMISELVPRRILTAGGLFILAFLLTQMVLPVVGPPGQPSSNTLSARILPVGSLFTWLLLESALLMLVSGCITSILQIYQQPVRWRGWIDRLALFALVSTWTVLQYSSGSTEQLPFTGSASYPFATIIISGQKSFGIPAISVNQLLCLPLALIGLVLLLRTKERLTAGDRRWLLVAIIPYLIFQWNDGANEILHFLPSIGQETAVSMNVLLFLVLIGAIFVMQRAGYNQFDLGDRVALLLLMVASALLQIELNSGAVHTPLAMPLPALSFSQVLTVVFITVGLWLVFFLRHRRSGIDRVFLSAFALACAIMEFAWGQTKLQRIDSVASSADSVRANALALAYLYRFLAVLLLLAVLVAAILTIIRALRAIPQQQDTLANPQARVDRLITFGVVLVSFLLLLAFTGQNVLYPSLTHFNILLNQMTTLTPSLVLTIVYLLLALLLPIFGISAFFRLFSAKPVGGADRLFFLVADVTCILLLLVNKDVKSLPLLSESTQQMFGSTAHVIVVNFVAQLSIVGAALVSLFWLRRPFTTRDRCVLCIIFAGSAILALVQPAQSQFFLSLLALIPGTLIAMQIERVRVGTRIS